MVTISATADIPIDRSAAFDALTPFDAHLAAAPAVASIKREGDGGIETTYRIELARFGQTGTLTTTVTAVDPPAALRWTARRDITGGWTLESHGDGTRLVVWATVDRSVLDRVNLGRGLLVIGLEAVLTRAFARELQPVLEHLVESAGGDPADARLVDVEVDGSDG